MSGRVGKTSELSPTAGLNPRWNFVFFKISVVFWKFNPQEVFCLCPAFQKFPTTIAWSHRHEVQGVYQLVPNNPNISFFFFSPKMYSVASLKTRLREREREIVVWEKVAGNRGYRCTEWDLEKWGREEWAGERDSVREEGNVKRDVEWIETEGEEGDGRLRRWRHRGKKRDHHHFTSAKISLSYLPV